MAGVAGVAGVARCSLPDGSVAGVAGVAGVALMSLRDLSPCAVEPVADPAADPDAAPESEPLLVVVEEVVPLNELPVVESMVVVVELPGTTATLERVTPQSLMQTRVGGSNIDRNCSSVQRPGSPVTVTLSSRVPDTQRSTHERTVGSKREMNVCVCVLTVVLVDPVTLAEPLAAPEVELLRSVLEVVLPLPLRLVDEAGSRVVVERVSPVEPRWDDDVAGVEDWVLLPVVEAEPVAGLLGSVPALVDCASAVPVASATSEVRMNAGAGWRMGCSFRHESDASLGAARGPGVPRVGFGRPAASGRSDIPWMRFERQPVEIAPRRSTPFRHP